MAMTKPARVVLYVGLLLTLQCSPVMAGHKRACPDEALLAAVVDIYAEPNETAAIDKTDDLLDEVLALSPGTRVELHDRTISAIASLLRHPSNDVKIYAAHALGELGARAAGKLPELRAARDSWREVIHQTETIGFYSPVDGVSEINDVIEKIETDPNKHP